MNNQESIYHFPDMHVTDPVDFFAEAKGVPHDVAEREVAWQQAITPEPNNLNTTYEQQFSGYNGDQEAQVARTAAMAAFSRTEPVAQSVEVQEVQATPEQIMRTVGANLVVLRNNVLDAGREEHVVF